VNRPARKQNAADTSAADGRVTTQATTMPLAMFQRTAETQRAAPTPMAPVTVRARRMALLRNLTFAVELVGRIDAGRPQGSPGIVCQ
jgi:hypothetical protein